MLVPAIIAVTCKEAHATSTGGFDNLIFTGTFFLGIVFLGLTVITIKQVKSEKKESGKTKAGTKKELFAYITISILSLALAYSYWLKTHV